MARYEDLSVGRLAMVNRSIPDDGAPGYLPGSFMGYDDPDALALGAQALFVNLGTITSCKFRGIGPAYGPVIQFSGKATTAGGDTTETIAVPGLCATRDIPFACHSVSDDTDQIVSVAATSNTITIVGSEDPSTAHAYDWATVVHGGVPAFDIVFAGTHTTVGGAAAEAITITGLLATDLAFVCYGATDDTDVIAKAVCTTNTLTVTCSADPSTTHSLHYIILRAAGRSKPSHYIAYAGTSTTAGGAAAEAITVTGAKATDIPFVCYNVTDDTDSILKSVVTANTLTVTMSADPSTAHALSYMLVREYE